MAIWGKSSASACLYFLVDIFAGRIEKLIYLSVLITVANSKNMALNVSIVRFWKSWVDLMGVGVLGVGFLWVLMDVGVFVS